MTSRVEGDRPDNFVTSSRWRGEMPYRKVVEPQRQIRKALAGMKPFYSRPFNRLDTWRYGTAAAIEYQVARRDPGLSKTTVFAAHAKELVIIANEGVLADPDLIKLAWFSFLLRPRADHDRFVPHGAKDFVNAVASGAAPPEQRQVLLMDSLAAVSRLRRQSGLSERVGVEERRQTRPDLEPRVQMLGSLFQSLDAVLLEPANRSEEEIAGLTQDDLLLWRIGMAYPKVLARLAALMPDVSVGEREAQAAAYVSGQGVGDTVFLGEFRRRRDELDRRPKMNKARAVLVRSPLYALGSQEILLEAAGVALTVFPSIQPEAEYSFERLMDEERECRRRESNGRTAEVRFFVTLGELIQGYWQKIWKSPLPGSPAAQAARWRSLSLSLAAMAELVRAEAEDFPPAWVPVDGSDGVMRRVFSPQVAADSGRFAGMVNDLVHAYHYQYEDDKEAITTWNAGVARKGDGKVTLPSNQVIPDHGLMELAHRLLGEVSNELTPKARERILDMIEDRGIRKKPFRIPRPGIMKILGLLARDKELGERARRVQGQLLAEAAMEMALNAPLVVTRARSFEAGTQWGAAHVLYSGVPIERDSIGFEIKYGHILESLAIGLQAAGPDAGELYARFLYPFVVQVARADVLARLYCQDKQRQVVPDARFHLPEDVTLETARVGANPIDGVLAELEFLLSQTDTYYWRSDPLIDGVEVEPRASRLYDLLRDMIAMSDRFPGTAGEVMGEIFGVGETAAPAEPGTRPEAGKGEEAADEEGVIEAPYQIVDVGGA